MQTVRRLIDQFIPDSYQLSIELRRPEREFEGMVVIQGVSPADSGSLAVHAKDLTISTVTVDGKEADYAPGEHDELTITHPDIRQGRHIVVISFSGRITDAMHGLYPCYYEADGVKKELLATQFESHHAREVFPCIDEPEAKALFDLTLTTEKDVTVLGNTDIKEQLIENGQLVTRFATTPRMSTYLLAWVVGELQKKSGETKSGVEVNVWSTLAHPQESLEFALDIGVRSIDFFDEYFDVPYPLTKCDHVALPDFSSGAMENWGLITYREMALLADPATTSISSKHYIATVIAHEVSHQWFGNLVTMKWWNNLWLNESFATLMEYIAIDALHPDWNVWLDFATVETVMALRRDSLEGVQPVQVDVHHPDEISTLFDGAIVYAKGARLMRMLEQYIGPEAFRAGLKDYFTEHTYGNTEGDDLWRALGEASGKDITALMNTWISQPGYPVLHAGQSGSDLTLKQEQFFIGSHGPSDKLWPIPLNASSPDIPALLTDRELTVALTGPGTLRFNTGDTAHFITKYDDALLGALIKDVKSGNLTSLDRLQLLDEQTLLARAGYVSSSQLIPLLDAYRSETAEPVWDIISMAVRELRKFVEDDETIEKRLRALSADLARTQYQRLGWEPRPDESETDTKLRANIISMMLYGEESEVIEKALSIFRSHDLEELDPELRPLIISSAVRHGGDPKLVDKLIATYRSAISPELQQDIAVGITSTKNADKLGELLASIKDPSTVRPQDAARWFAHVIYNRDGRALGWLWLKTNWDWIKSTFSGDKSYDDFPRIAANALITSEQLSDYKTFFAPMRSEPALTRVIDLGITEIESRVNLIERDQAAVKKALAEL
jgi:aminopeptidase N